jgi:hypothetical protein
MNCAGIQELLSEYIDGTLDAKAVQVVEKHISVCEDCKETLASLSEMVEELNAFEPLMAPADFLEKIHQRMEPRSGFSRLFRKLFVPFKIKIPLQLAAAATASILVVMVLNLQKSEYHQKMQLLKSSKSEKLIESLKSDRLTSEFKTKSYPNVLKKAPEKLSDSEQGMAAQKSGVKTLAQPSVQRESEPPASISAKVRPSPGKSHPIELALVLNTSVTDAASKPDLGMKAAPVQKSDEKSGEKERTDKDLSGRHLEIRQNNQVENFLSSMDHILRSLKGNILTKEYHKQSNRLKSIHVQLPSENYTSFCRELTRLAVFKTPPPVLSDESLETLNLLINFAP